MMNICRALRRWIPLLACPTAEARLKPWAREMSPLTRLGLAILFKLTHYQVSEGV